MSSVRELIEFGMCGSVEEQCNPYELTAPLVRQRLLLLINSKPLGVEDVAKELGMVG